jgi:16S rRNA (guanine527-N7)-methyltransferase
VNRRLAELVERYGLGSRAQGQLAALLDLVAHDPTAPTAVTAPTDAIDAHLADSLAGLEAPPLREARRIADLGAGAGFPGLVLAAARPDAAVALVESMERRCAWLCRAGAAAGIGNAAVVCGRAEEWAAGLGANDAVTARAVAPLSVVVEYAAPLLARGGSLVSWRGRRGDGEEAAAAAAAALLGLEPAGVLPVRPFPAAHSRHLHVFRKVAETPPGYPRRPGAARKRPLGRSDRGRR